MLFRISVPGSFDFFESFQVAKVFFTASGSLAYD